jgi:hypothetical protein
MAYRSNLFYLVSPAQGRSQTREFLLDLTRFIHVAPATTEALRYAAALRMRDFEDAMQVAAAAACRAAVIATRNTADYKTSPVRAATARERSSGCYRVSIEFGRRQGCAEARMYLFYRGTRASGNVETSSTYPCQHGFAGL